MAGVLVIVSSSDKKNVQLLKWMIITYSFTFLSEVIGVHTGLIFGSYIYGNILGLKLLGVPLIIGFNWVLIILGAINIAESIEKNAFTTAMLAAVLAVLFDLMLEPIAIKLDYWNWTKGGIPLRNYYAWFGIAFISSYLYKKMSVKTDTDIFRFYFVLQLIFFVVLSLFIG